MNVLLGIFSQLGVDNTVFYQLAVAVIVFFGCKFFFLTKMKSILQTREKLTTELVKESGVIAIKAQEAAEKFRNEVESVYRKNQEKFATKKSELSQVEREVLAENDKEIEALTSKTRAEHQNFLEFKKEELMGQVSTLSEELTTKFVK
jgi:F0F1-type ATP synthase membrane subunit b/b'